MEQWAKSVASWFQINFNIFRFIDQIVICLLLFIIVKGKFVLIPMSKIFMVQKNGS
jgi:hypothetical protein